MFISIRYFPLSVQIDAIIVTFQEEEMEFIYNENTARESANVTDRWVLSCMQSLVGFFETEMAGMTPGLSSWKEELSSDCPFIFIHVVFF